MDDAPSPGPAEVWSIPLPEGAGPPVSLWVNGTEVREGEGFEVHGGEIRLTRPLRARPPLGRARTLLLAIGIGVYGDLRGDSVDVSYTRAGRTEVISDLALRATPPPR